VPLRRGTLDRMQTLLRDETHCPGCCSHLRPADQYCLCCGIWLAGPEVAELRWIDSELGRVDAARARLIGRRAVLLGMLPATRRRPAPGAAGAGVRFSAAGAAGAAGQPSMQPEVSARVAARLLLAAGATLVVIAVIVFTVADWARIGPLGRCGILLAATALVLAAPRVLVRRGLNATAESVAAIGLALTIADAELARRLIGWHPADGAFAVAVAACVLAGAWAAYGAATRLNGPKLAAIGLAQLPCPLAAVGLVRLGGGPAAAVAGPIAIALVLNSVAGLALADWADRRGHRAEAAAGSAAAVAMWLSGVLTAAAVLAAGAERDGRPWLAAALTAAALVGILGPRRRLAALAWAAAVVSGALLAVGLAVPLAGSCRRAGGSPPWPAAAAWSAPPRLRRDVGCRAAASRLRGAASGPPRRRRTGPRAHRRPSGPISWPLARRPCWRSPPCCPFRWPSPACSRRAGRWPLGRDRHVTDSRSGRTRGPRPWYWH